MSSTHQVDRPERSRNARAQARHRAKRKAYIEQLEQTVTKLQLASGLSQEQISVMAPPMHKIRELEQENARLQKENDELRRLLTDTTHTNGRLSSDPVRRQPLPGSYPGDFRWIDRDSKRRKESLYISPSETPPHIANDLTSRLPPPLSVPQPISHHYGALTPANHSHNGQHHPFELPESGFQMPHTPSESSATSSPPFSPLPIQHSLHAPVDQRSHISAQHGISNGYAAHSTGHYSSVKVEDEHYMNSIHYSYTNGHTHHNGLDWQTGYSSERGHLHR